jgi:hypothetical protein
VRVIGVNLDSKFVIGSNDKVLECSLLEDERMPGAVATSVLSLAIFATAQIRNRRRRPSVLISEQEYAMFLGTRRYLRTVGEILKELKSYTIVGFLDPMVDEIDYLAGGFLSLFD